MNPKVEEFIELKVLDKYKPIIIKFRSFMLKEFSNIKEEMRGGTEKYYGVPVYRYNRIILTISPTKKGITFSFSNGKKFEDNYNLLEGKGNKTLNLRISQVENYDDEIMRYYIEQAIEHDKL